MDPTVGAGADGDIMSGLESSNSGAGGGQTPPSQNPPNPNIDPNSEPGETQPSEKDKALEAMLDAWEKGDALPGESGATSQDPLKGVDLNHPVVQKLIQDRQTQDRQRTMADVGRQLAASGVISRQAIPEFMEFLDGVMQLKERHDSMQNFLTKLDGSPLVLTANINQMVQKYGKFGVTADMLKMAARPDSSARELETVARTLAVLNRKNNVTDRAKRGADRVEDSRSRGGSSSGNDYMDLTKSADDLLRAGLSKR